MSEEISLEIVKKTQKILGKCIKKPPLTDKLLKKPPFRFLHDIVSTIIKETGFLKGLFTEEELKSDNVKEKDAKIAFLNKLIDAVKSITKTELNIRASKIVAGLEPANTNLLLQAIGKAINSKTDSSEYVSQLQSGQAVVPSDKKQVKKNIESKDTKRKIKDKNATPKISKSKQAGDETPKSKRSIPSDSSRNKKDTKTSIKKNSVNKTREKEDGYKISNEKEIVNNGNDDGSEEKIKKDNEDVKAEIKNLADLEIPNKENVTVDTDPAKEEGNEFKVTEKKDDEHKNSEPNDNIGRGSLLRPKSARPKSGDKISERSKEASNKPLEMTTKQPSQRPKSSLRPPSVRPSSARPAAPRLRPDSALPLQEPVTMGNINVIVENVDTADDEETVVVIESTSEMIEDDNTVSDVSLKNKGHLVEQILEKINEGEDAKKSIEMDWEPNALQNKDGAAKEISQLRTFIQHMTKTANPLGKLMNYLHEDIDAMHSELQMWTTSKTQLFSEIQKQKRLSAESNKPLLSHLEQLQQEIKKQRQEIINIQSNIIRNDIRIKELLSK